MLSGKIDKILEMFAKKYPVMAEMADSWGYRGMDGIRKLFAILGEKYGLPGSLGLHMLVTPVVEVASDGKMAWDMWHSFGCNTIKEGDNLSAM